MQYPKLGIYLCIPQTAKAITEWDKKYNKLFVLVYSSETERKANSAAS
jgi:hypothetical protein